jgi:hypothetical protein
MAIALVSNIDAKPGANGGTTGSINTTGANLLIVAVAAYQAQTATPSDNKSNTWTALTGRVNGTNEIWIRIFYCVNPTVGSGHTVTFSATSSFPVIMFSAFSGAGAYDKESGGGSSGNVTSIQTGSLTPTENNSLLYTALCTGVTATGYGINSSFSVVDSELGQGAVNMGAACGRKIQTTAGAENPTWSWTTTNSAAVAMAVFKAAAVTTKRAKIIGGGFI